MLNIISPMIPMFLRTFKDSVQVYQVNKFIKILFELLNIINTKLAKILFSLSHTVYKLIHITPIIPFFGEKNSWDREDDRSKEKIVDPY